MSAVVAGPENRQYFCPGPLRHMRLADVTDAQSCSKTRSMQVRCVLLNLTGQGESFRVRAVWSELKKVIVGPAAMGASRQSVLRSPSLFALLVDQALQNVK